MLKNITSKNHKAYLLFLILTLILWFTIQMVKSYNFQNEITIQLSNMPNHVVLDSSSQSLGVNLNANGLKLWKYNISAKKLNIDFNTFEKDSFQLTISDNKIKKIIAEKYEFDIESIELDKTLMAFSYRMKQTKVVPIQSKINLSFASGFNTLDTLKLIPDSVTITGSMNDLKKVNFVQTKKLAANDISDTIQGRVELIKPDANVELSNDNVQYYLPVEKFSENALMINIETINVPDTLDLNVFPNQAKVSFLVALKSFEKISYIDFKVICDYSKRYQEDAIMIPSLVKYPNNILNPKLHVRKVDYLIKQKP